MNRFEVVRRRVVMPEREELHGNPADLELTFDRSEHEAALEALRDLEPEPWRIDQ